MCWICEVFEVFIWRTSDHIYVCLTVLSAQYYVFDLHLYVVVCAILVYLDSIYLCFCLSRRQMTGSAGGAGSCVRVKKRRRPEEGSWGGEGVGVVG